MDALIFSYGSATAVTPSDSTALAYKALYIGVGGDVVVITRSGDTVTFKSVPTGAILPIDVQKVKAATTATSILGLN